jgi:hypothetical protein
MKRLQDDRPGESQHLSRVETYTTSDCPSYGLVSIRKTFLDSLGEVYLNYT